MEIKVDKVCKEVNGYPLLSNVSFTVKDGMRLGITGQPLTGKSCLVNMLLGFEKPDSGEITGVAGHKVSAVFTEPALAENLSAVANVSFMTGVDPDTVRYELMRCDIYDDTDKPVAKMSESYKRRVAICRAMLREADIYIMDEPFKDLEYAQKGAIGSYIREKTKDKIVIFTTQDIEDIQEIGAYSFMLDDTYY